MNYKETLEYIHAVSWTGSRPGLERIEELLSKMGNPQDRLRYIHVGGTNGKGSFCAMLSSVLRCAGYKTGLYTSPYVKCFNERMSIDGEMISNDELSSIVGYVKEFAEEMSDKPTEFELITAVAFEYFYRNGCDIVILEVGLGGRLDATNIIKTPVLSVITGIALDHTAILGNTIEEIAKEKAGICKKGVPVLYGGADESAKRVIEERAASLSCPFCQTDHACLSSPSYSIDKTVFSFGGYSNLSIRLLGKYQLFNAANVLTAIEILNENGFALSEDIIREGLSSAVWQARFELLSSDPLIIFDGGHNPEGVSATVESIKTYFGEQRVRIITGVMKDKDYTFIAKKIREVARECYTVRPNNPRALSAEEYAEALSTLGTPATPCKSLSEAISICIEASKKDATPIIALGSLYMYEEFANALEDFAVEN